MIIISIYKNLLNNNFKINFIVFKDILKIIS